MQLTWCKSTSNKENPSHEYWSRERGTEQQVCSTLPVRFATAVANAVDPSHTHPFSALHASACSYQHTPGYYYTEALLTVSSVVAHQLYYRFDEWEKLGQSGVVAREAAREAAGDGALAAAVAARLRAPGKICPHRMVTDG